MIASWDAWVAARREPWQAAAARGPFESGRNPTAAASALVAAGNPQAHVPWLSDLLERLVLTRWLPQMTLVPSPDRPASQSFGRVRGSLAKLKRSDPAPHSPRPPLEGIALWARFKRLTELGWPRSFPIVQFPNAALIVAFLAGQAASLAHGASHSDAAAVSYLALAIWAYEELVHGVNWFRHLLGFAYLISTGAHLALALHR
jgi:hypothetical protein